MKHYIYLFILLISVGACDETDDPVENRTVKFSHKILEGYYIQPIAFDAFGNAWIGTLNQGLIKYNTTETKVYDHTNSPLPRLAGMICLAIDSKNNIWMGRESLIKFDGTTFTEWSPSDSGVPVNFVPALAIDSKDNVWFASCWNDLGGLVKFDGTDFTVYTTENSDLPTNQVGRIFIDGNDTIWFAQNSLSGESFITKLYNNICTVYSGKAFGFEPFYIGDVEVNSKNEVCASIDYVFSSTVENPGPQLFIFNKKTTRKFQFDNVSNILEFVIGKEDRIWGYGLHEFVMFDGEEWMIDRTTFEDIIVTSIALADEDEIWVGTVDGIYIFKYE